MRTLLKILFLSLVCFSAKAQNPFGLPFPNSPGSYYNVGWIRNDSGSITALRTPNFTPLFYGTEITYLNPGVDTSKWLWIGRWVKELKQGDASGLTLNSFSATSPLVYNNLTGNYSCPTCGTGGGGLTSLNGLTATTQTFAIGTAGSDFGISSVGSTHTFNIPTASASNRGLLGTSDFTSFSAKQPQLNGTGFIKAAGTTISYDNSSYYLASNPNNYVGLGAFSALSPALYNSSTGVHSVDTTTGLTHLATQAFVLANQASGTITGAGNLVPIFTTSVSSNTLIFSLTNSGANTVLGRNSGSTGAPAYFVPNNTIMNTWFGATIGTVTGVTNSDGTITIGGTSAAPTVSIAPSHANTWTGVQTQPAPIFTSLTSSGANDSVLTVDPSTGQVHRRSGTFNLFLVQGLKMYGNSNDSAGLGGSFYQPDTIATNGNAFLITGLPNKSTALGTDSLLIETLAGQLYKLPIVTGGITQLTGDVTAGPGSGSQASTISALAVTTGKLAANAVTLGKMSTNVSNSLLGYDGSGNPADITVGTGLALSGSTLTSTGGLASIANFTYLGVSNLTGSSAVPVAINQNVYNVLDYGIKNDSSADMTAALQALINFVPTGSVIWFPAGKYRQDGKDTIGHRVTLRGAGPQLNLLYGQLGNPFANTTCGIWHGGQNDTAFYVNALGVSIENFSLINSFSTQGSATSRGIYYQNGANATLLNCTIQWFGRLVEIKNGGEYYIHRNFFLDATGDDELKLQDSVQNDDGDATVDWNFFVQLTHNCTNQVEYVSGGGLRFDHNKGNALHHATTFFYAPFVGTIITEATNNGSEQCNGPEFWVKLANSSSTLNILKIQNNYMDGSGVGGHIVVDGSAAGGGIQACSINDNILAMGVADTGIVLNNVHYSGVGQNTYWGGKLKVVTLGSVNQSNNMGFSFFNQIQTLAEVGNVVTFELAGGDHGYLTATTNDTLLIVAPKPGGSPFELRYTQDATGGRTLRCQGFGEVWTGAGLGGYELIGVDPRPNHVTIIKGFVNPNGAATITSINKTSYAGGIKYLDASINGESTDSTFFYLNKRLRIGFSSTVNDYGTTIQDFGAFSQNKDSLQLVANSLGTINMLAYDTVSHKYVRAPVPSGGSSITLTTTGTSGAATLVGSTLNIPVYSSGGGGTPIGGDQATQYDSAGFFSGNNGVFITDYTNKRQFITGNTAASTVDGLVLNTSNAATTGAPKWSPRLRFTGNDWTGAASHPIDWIVENQTANGADQGSLAFSYQVNGGAKTQMLSLTTGGFMDYNANSQTLGLIIRQAAGSNYTNIGQETIGGVSQVFLDATSTPTASAGVHIQDNGSMGLGVQTLSSRFMMYKQGSAYSLANNTTNGVLLNGAAWTYNDNGTAASGTVAHTAISAFGVPTITATNTGVVYTTASTLYLAGDPIFSTNVTGTNKYTLEAGTGTGAHVFFNSLTGIGTAPISTSWLALGASTAGVSSMNLAAGATVTSPNQGDLWSTTGHLNYRDGSTTYDLLSFNNFYTTDGTLSSSRTVAGGGNSLTLGSSGSNLGTFTVNAAAEALGGPVAINGAPLDTHAGIMLPASTTTSVPLLITNGVDITTPSNGYLWYNNTNLYFAQSSSVKVDLLAGIRNYQHSISTPTTGGTVNLVKNQYNIINPSGTLVALTVNLPSSPANNDVVYIKYTQAISTVTYGNGTVVDGITAPTAGGVVVLTFDSGTTSWY